MIVREDKGNFFDGLGSAESVDYDAFVLINLIKESNKTKVFINSVILFLIRPSPKGRPLQECPSVVCLCVVCGHSLRLGMSG